MNQRRRLHVASGNLLELIGFAAAVAGVYLLTGLGFALIAAAVLLVVGANTSYAMSTLHVPLPRRPRVREKLSEQRQRLKLAYTKRQRNRRPLLAIDFGDETSRERLP